MRMVNSARNEHYTEMTFKQADRVIAALSQISPGRWGFYQGTYKWRHGPVTLWFAEGEGDDDEAEDRMVYYRKKRVM